jgi:hypothetical protein
MIATEHTIPVQGAVNLNRVSLLTTRYPERPSWLQRLGAGVPVHEGRWRVDRVVDELDELLDKVISDHPAAVLDQQLDGCFDAEVSFCVLPERRRGVLEGGSKRWSRSAVESVSTTSKPGGRGSRSSGMNPGGDLLTAQAVSVTKTA